MMRLPSFTYRAARSVQEAADLLAAAPGDTMLVAGGTDLLPNMKRRQQTPKILVGLHGIADKPFVNVNVFTIGAGVKLSHLVRDQRVRTKLTALWQAASQVATPHLRNMATLGGNICLDTRCNYYDQNYEWRKAIDFCMKKDGKTCWVAPSSPKCLAVSSTDTAPALIALGASVRLVSADGTRTVSVNDLYRNDGINYIARKPTEILSTIQMPALEGWRSTYWKLRRRGSFDFPVLGVAAAAKIDQAGTVEDARIVLGAVASRPILATSAGQSLVGKELSDAAIAEAADLASQPARPMDNTDFSLHWRKRVTRDFVTNALRELRGDDVKRYHGGQGGLTEGTVFLG
jgi:4-hydroxybenzoyl-CoA reductase subunit beta